jgi:hypothetical protein
MMNDEEVYVTADGLGRAAIVRRADGLLCIHIHWIWPEIEENMPDPRRSWLADETPSDILYNDHYPRPGLYGTVEDARREIRAIEGFSDAVLKTAPG